jgi:hypothetical protein
VSCHHRPPGARRSQWAKRQAEWVQEAVGQPNFEAVPTQTLWEHFQGTENEYPARERAVAWNTRPPSHVGG